MSRARILADYVSSGDELADKAPKANPVFTGVATAPSLVLTPGPAPGTPAEGEMYYDSTSDSVKIRNPSAWKSVGLLDEGSIADGGTITNYTNDNISYKVHTFLASGTFTLLFSTYTVDILVLGSGGSGGGGANSNYGAGGGAGGMLWRPNKSLGAGDYTVTIGDGGAWTNSQTNGVKGTNCSFSGSGYTLTGNAGGAGSGTSSTSPSDCTGGCGGGAGRDAGSNAAGASNQTDDEDASAYPYGFAGGIATGTSCTSAGGGGGTGQVGQNGEYDCNSNRTAGKSEGGYGRNILDGVSNSEFIDFMWSAQAGTNTTNNGLGGTLVSSLGSKPSDIRLGGGGGGAYEIPTSSGTAQLALGGVGGGGRGGSRYPGGSAPTGTNGLTNTGGGGGAGQMLNSGANGGNGAKGIVIIRYTI